MILSSKSIQLTPLTLLCFVTLIGNSQNYNFTIPDSTQREIPILGLNGNTVRGPSWINSEFNDSVATMAPTLLRYPAGNMSNYWDWETGWFYNQAHLDTVLGDTIYTMKDSWYTFDTIDIRPITFHNALEQIDAQGIYVMNMMSSSLEKQISDLEQALNIGLSIDRIELGSEFNHGNDFVAYKYPTAGDYAREAALWADEIRTLLPQVEIAVVAGNRGSPGDRAYNWNDSLYTYCPDVDALVWHLYLYLNDDDSLYSDKQVLAYPFYKMPLYETWRAFKDDNPDLADYQVWVTEYNLFDKSNDKIFSNSWAHVLFLAGINDNFLKNNKTSILIQHNVSGFTEFDAINCQSNANFSKRAPGISSLLWNQLTQGMQSCKQILFDSSYNDTVNYTKDNGITVNIEFPTAFGWLFENESSAAALFTNLSQDSIYVNIDPWFNSDVRWEKWTANSLRDRFDNSGELYISTDTAKQAVLIPSYSICTVKPATSGAVGAMQIIELQQGWNMISSYVLPTNPNLDTIVQDISSNIIILKDQLGQAYLPNQSFNGIGEWNSLQGYQIKVSNYCELSIQGEVIPTQSTLISLPAGWSIMPFLGQDVINAQLLLNPIVENVFVLKNYLGNAILPNYNYWGIDYLHPDQGYLIKTYQNTEFYYPGN